MNPRGARIIKIDTSGEIASLLGDLPTPSALSDLDTDQYQTEAIKQIDSLLKINALRWGTLYSFINEQKGKVVQNIFPIKTDSSTQISSSSSVELELHTETAFHSERPDTVFLYCLRADPQAGTVVAQLDDFISDVDEKTKSLLKQPIFETFIDESFKRSTTASVCVTMPILSDDEKSISFDKALMRGKTEEADAAINVLVQAIEKHKKIVTLRQGEALVLHNSSTIHGRTPFKARFDGTDRWLKRIMIKPGGPSKESSFFGPENYFVVKTLH